jgi:hypothetical protein
MQNFISACKLGLAAARARRHPKLRQRLDESPRRAFAGPRTWMAKLPGRTTLRLSMVSLSAESGE